MLRKTFHIAVIGLLALNLMGSWVFASVVDCGMPCCAPEQEASSGFPAFEAASCCSASEMACNFNSTPGEELFDEVVCCFGQPQLPGSGIAHSPGSSSFLEGALWSLHYPREAPPPASSDPLFLKNLSILC